MDQNESSASNGRSNSKSPSKSSGTIIKSPSKNRVASIKLDELIDSIGQISVDLSSSNDPSALISPTMKTSPIIAVAPPITTSIKINPLGSAPQIKPNSSIKPIDISSVAGLDPTPSMSSSSAPLKIITKKISSIHLPKLSVMVAPTILPRQNKLSPIKTPIAETEPLPEIKPFKRVFKPILTPENVGNIELPEGVTIIEPIPITIPREQLTEVSLSSQHLQQAPPVSGVRSRADILKNIDRSRLVVSTAGQTKSYKVEELKGFFKMLGEHPKGNKPELVAKLQQMIEESGIQI